MNEVPLSAATADSTLTTTSARPTTTELSGWWPRVGAKLIDSFIIWVPYTILFMLGMDFMSRGQEALGWLFYIISTIEGVGGWCWVIYQTGKTGQSIGKRLMRTRVIGRKPGPIGFGHALLHETLSLFVDLLPLFIGYLRPLVNEKRQTFSDSIMGTLTLRVARPRA